jgi:lipopolysaccharide export system protein LptA
MMFSNHGSSLFQKGGNSIPGVLLNGLAILGLVALVAGRVHGQVPQNITAKGINLPYFDGNNPKALFLAETADPLPGGLISATDFRMYLFGKGGTNDVELIVQTPKCTFDYTTKRVWSPGSLKAYSTTTNYVIRGEGFHCLQASGSSVLEISNKVHTTVEREVDATNSKPAAPIEIFSDRFRFVSEQREGGEVRVANYYGHVFADDPELSLNSEYLRVGVPSGTNKVRNIYAKDNVVITNKADGSRATGDEAVYNSDERGEVLRLTGKPTWRDAQNEIRGEVFVLNRRQQIVLVQTNAQLKIPRGSVASNDMFGSGKSKTKSSTNQQPVEVTSDFVEIQLPTTNRPSRSLIARTNVVILSPADDSRATADTAVFHGDTGILELLNKAAWQTTDMLARGDKLSMDSSNRIFRAQGQAYLKVLSSSKGDSRKNTNSYFEIFSKNYEVVTNMAKFRGEVRAKFIDGNSPSQLVCRELDVYFKSNQVELIVAVGKVVLEQRPNLTKLTNATERTLRCENLKLKRSPSTGNIETLLAETNAVLSQKTGSGDPVSLTAATVTMTFSGTNKLESLLAEKDVHVISGKSEAWGEHGVYTTVGEKEIFEITGKPRAKIVSKQSDGSDFEADIPDAEVLIWEPKTGKYRIRKGGALGAKELKQSTKSIK